LRATLQLYDKSVQILPPPDVESHFRESPPNQFAGKTMRNVAPAFSALVTSISPP
jgi:hypothetical protein